MNILSLEQLQSKGLDTPPGVRLACTKAGGYTKARTTWPVRRLNKAEYNLQQVASCSTTGGTTWVNNNSHTSLPRESHTSYIHTAFCTFRLGVSQHFVPLHYTRTTYRTTSNWGPHQMQVPLMGSRLNGKTRFTLRTSQKNMNNNP